jgi:hypothetical protein
MEKQDSPSEKPVRNKGLSLIGLVPLSLLILAGRIRRETTCSKLRNNKYARARRQISENIPQRKHMKILI